MKTRFLFPHQCKIIGFIILIIAFLLGFLFNNYFEGVWTADISFLDWLNRDNINSFTNVDMTFTITLFLLVSGGLLAAFSKEKIEDEFVASLRLSSLIWAVFVNYALLLIAITFIYGLNFINILFFNTFTVLLIFIIRFNFLFYKYSKKQNEK